MEKDISLKIGQRVECNGCFGTLLFVGKVPPTEGIWLGIDWDDYSRGKHDGTHEGIRYFKTRHPHSGSFVRFGKVNFGQTCVTAIHNRYGEVKDDDTAGINKENLAIAQKEMNAPFLEVVGFDKVNKKQSQFEKLRVAYLSDYLVNGAGPKEELRKLCPRIRELDLSRNLVSNWQDVADIVVQLDELQVLNLSENLLQLPDSSAELLKPFKSLEHIVLATMEYSWNGIKCCIDMWPHIKTLQVPFNRITSVETPSSCILYNLKQLDLEGNPINNWAEINKLGNLPCLEILNVCKIGVSEVYFPADQPDKKTGLFPALKYIHLSENNIDQWEPLCELNRLKSLDQLRFRDNPVLQMENMETCRQLIIARIENLQKLNGVVIESDERKGAEIDYLKKYGPAWLALAKSSDAIDLHSFITVHPRYPKLVEKYGAPEEGEVTVASKTIKTNLISVEICSPEHSVKVYRKRLPKSMLIQKLIGLVQKLFNTGNIVPTLSCINSKNPHIEFPLDMEFKDLHFYSIEDGDNIIVHW